jgi:glucosamine--fructose-6-phosphate aminotransferase (isomerizing)
LKEISEAPLSFRKTLRGKVVDQDGRLTVVLGEETLPTEVRQALAKGDIRRIFVIGQGTAAIAGQVLAANLVSFLRPAAGIAVSALPATELSGFWLDDDMSDALVVAISQSGTTTDTNRTVDLVRARGASVVAVVNRRNSDLVEKADGVLYTSDGRDVEMSVPSTKAFYAQIAAGFLLALALAEEAGGSEPRIAHELLVALRDLPGAMERVLERRPSIAAAAWEHAPRRRHWAVVGNGANRLAAAELRIKLSELAYKSIAHDATEDKKHIDLSSEPLILVCATGLAPEAAADVAKELAIYRAHKAAPVVIATEGTEWGAALAVIEVPAAHPALAFVLSTMAGHLFGYEAALAIDAQARGLREMRAMVEGLVANGAVDDPMLELGQRLAPAARAFHEQVREGAYNGALEAGTAVGLSSVLRYTTGTAPLEFYELDHGRVATPGVIVEDLLASLTQAIDELTRPVDAIRHQAKTVTVGISRSEEALFGAPLVVETLRTGARRDRLTYRVLRTLVALGPAVEEVTGYTRYEISDFATAAGAPARIRVVDKGGVALQVPSRADVDGGTPLRGTKHRAATLREVTVAKGATDGRTVVLIPEIRRGDVVGMTLLHARFADRLSGATMRAVLEGYQARYGAIVDAVTEKEPHFDDERLRELPVIDLLTAPVLELAKVWTQ